MYGNYKRVRVINGNQMNRYVKVDACIADEIQTLNDYGVVTVGCCCSHGKAGQVTEYSNKFGNWKTYTEPPMTLIEAGSVGLAKKLGYRPFQYFYADGSSGEVWQLQLKTGCMNTEECKEWHKENGLPFLDNQGVIESK